MEEKIINSVKEGEEIIKRADKKEISEKIGYYSRWISIFQHERLIHLIVTVTFAIIAIMCMLMLILQPSIAMAVLFIFLFIMTGAYIRHYYYLENCTQKLYDIYDKMEQLIK